MSQRKIAEAVGCSQATVSNRIKAISEEKTPEVEIPHSQTPSEPIVPIFDEEDCDVAPAINPFQATEKALREADAEGMPNVTSIDHNIGRASIISEALRILEQELSKGGIEPDHQLTLAHLQNTYGA